MPVISHGESYIGLAAGRVGMTFDFCRQDKFPFFQDKIELIRIKNGQSNLEDTQIYFDIHKQIEAPKRSLLQKITNRLIQKAVFYYRSQRLRIFVKKEPNFSKIFG